MLILFLHGQVLHLLVSFSPTGQQPTGSPPLLWEKQDADAQVSIFPVSVFVGTCLLCVYTCPCMLLACHLGRWLKYLASCLSPFLKPAVTWPRESPTGADTRGWDVLSLCRHCCSYIAKIEDCQWFQEPARCPVPHVAALRPRASGRAQGNSGTVWAAKVQPLL